MQGLISMAFVVGVFVIAVLPKIGEDGVDHEKAFDALLFVTAAIFWFLFFLTGVALMVLRHREPDTPRPFKTPAYPLLPLVFCGWCGYMVIGSLPMAAMVLACRPDDCRRGIAAVFSPTATGADTATRLTRSAAWHELSRRA